jgi:formylglycine-generating enzyme required for sulfatase activity
MKRFLLAAAAAVFLASQAACGQACGKSFTNSIGAAFVRIEPGTFRMGRLSPADGLDAGYEFVAGGGDWDEKPARKVTISRPFYIQAAEVTAEQYRLFDPGYDRKGKYATGVTWHEAAAFAEWLSEKEAKTYRLPTEAEWEYACRAGTESWFSSGDRPPAAETANGWGVRNMHTAPAEWVLDWHGLYPHEDQADPTGPAAGMVRVLRGAEGPYHARSASRWAMPPGCGRRHGFDFGFRLVRAEMPGENPAGTEPFSQTCVKPAGDYSLLGPDPEKPYFKRRLAMPIPPENDQDDAGPCTGVHPAVLAHNHSPGFAALSNGDLLAVYFSSSTATTENETNVAFVQARLRHGCDSWDMPELFYDCADYNDESGLLWLDGEVLRFFGGGRKWPRQAPFKTACSTDNGATWSELALPEIEGLPGELTPQPITSAFRDPAGGMYFAMDGNGARSFLWKSADDGRTWTDMGGRTDGRHSAIVPVKDESGSFSGRLLCLGTKKGLFADSWMQQNVSLDWGKTWQPKTKSPFPYLSSNQRGHLSRLKSGRLCFVSDHQARSDAQPPGYTDRGCFAALSGDEGNTWHVKTIPGTLPHESRSMPGITRHWTSASHADGTVGYVTVAQAPNGLINVLTTMNHPCLHFAFNEAWVDSSAGAETRPDPSPCAGEVRNYSLEHPCGRPRARWSATVLKDGLYLMHGTESWYYQSGRKRYEATYRNGRKTGDETYWTAGGARLWAWRHGDDGASTWTHFWPDGTERIVSNWKDSAKIAHGGTVLYGAGGGVEKSLIFSEGILQRNRYTNSIGMNFVRVEGGSFEMGTAEVPAELCGGRKYLLEGDPDEKPVHKVKISRSFMMAATEVTNAQYERFDPSHRHVRGKLGFSVDSDEAVVFVSWTDAKRFCDWLSEKEGMPYRLPTEAEWEYACRAGTTTAFNTGNALPEQFHKNVGESWYPDPERGKGTKEIVRLHVAKTAPNAWGLYDMHGNVEEWTADWYGPYAAGGQTDPVGYAGGDCKVARGGSHSTELYYLRSGNRSGAIPQEKSWLIGFRPVIGPAPETAPPEAPPPPLNRQNVSRRTPACAAEGPDPSKPYFAGPKKYVRIPEGSSGPIFSHHNHVPNIAACANGDLLAIWYTCVSERGRELAIVASRLRRGSGEWDRATMFWDQPDRNDHTPALWRDTDGTLYHFNGYSVAATWGPLAVVLRTSSDHGATWTRAALILAEHNIRQMPIESIFRAADGTIILPCDAVTGGSGGTAIYLSRDNGATWLDPGGTIAGIHACVAQIPDGSLIAYGRGDNIDGRMPKSVSQDMGESWRYSASGFHPVGGGQRPVMLRLAEGPLVLVSFAGKGKKPMTITGATGGERPVTGMFAALSYDDGLTWPHIRLVSHDGPDETVETMDGRPFTLGLNSAEPRGYLAICRADNGVIHLITSRQHYAFNLKWLETPAPGRL